MTYEELKEKLRLHELWLNHDNGVQLNLCRKNLRGKDLHFANMSNASLREADLRRANLSRTKLNEANLTGADLRCADLRGADLFGADLNGADLNGADLDCSCMPLWCGSLYAHFDDRHIKQIAYHLVKAGLNSRNTSAEVKNELKKIINLANQFHRTKECGIIEVKEDDK